jgi:hypothetical protein
VLCLLYFARTDLLTLLGGCSFICERCLASFYKTGRNFLARTGKEEQREFDAIRARSYGPNECEGLAAARSPWQYRRAFHDQLAAAPAPQRIDAAHGA